MGLTIPIDLLEEALEEGDVRVRYLEDALTIRIESLPVNLQLRIMEEMRQARRIED